MQGCLGGLTIKLSISKGYDEHVEKIFQNKHFAFNIKNISSDFFDFPLTNEWSKAGLVQNYASEPLRYVLLDGDVPIGLFQGIVQRNFFVSVMKAGSTSGNGIIINSAYGIDALKFFISKIIEKEKFSLTSIYSPYELSLTGFSTKKNFTYYINLSNTIERISSDMNKKCRWAIRKAIKNKVNIEISNTAHALDTVYSLVSETAVAQSFSLPSRQWVNELHNQFKIGGHSLSVIAKCNGKPVSAGYFIGYSKKINWLFGGSNLKGYEVQAGNLVQLSIIEWAKKNGYIIYDMGGTNPNDPLYENIDKFKSSFGGSLITNYQMSHEKCYLPYLLKMKKWYESM